MRRLGIIAMSLVALFVWLTPVLASAQKKGPEKSGRFLERTTPVQRARFESRWMEKTLNLTDKQAAAIEAINLRAEEKIQSIYESQNNKLRKAEEKTRVGKEKNWQLERVLTEDQFEKYQAQKAEMQQEIQTMM